jgi:myo-inositol 2-dehydrogenase/D-chiro-inositol 1-dehydrogenase
MVITGSMIHDIHSARFLMGQEIATVYVTSLPAEPGREDTCRLVTLSCRFDDGALGLIDVNVEAAYGYSVSATVVGTQGTVVTADPVRAAVLSGFERHEDIPPDFPERFAEAYRAELDAWLASLQAGRAIGPSSWDGYASLVVAEACQRSVTSGQPAEVDMVERFGLFA